MLLSPRQRSRCERRLCRRHDHSHLYFISALLSALCLVVVGAFQWPPPPLMIRAKTGLGCTGLDRLRHQRIYALQLHSSKTGKVDDIDKTNEDISQQQQPDAGDLILDTQTGNTTCSGSHNVTKVSSDAKSTIEENNATPSSKSLTVPLTPRLRAAPVFLFPWSIWMKVRSTVPHMYDVDNNGSQSTENNSGKRKPKRRWEIPLTSKPFQGVEDLRSTIQLCIGAVALYFLVGMLVFPLWLEPSWTFIDALYFSMASLTTVGYGDVVISSGNHFRAKMAKLFVLSFNISAVCISVSALGIITRLAMAQERKLMAKAKEEARQKFIQMFYSDYYDKEEEGPKDEEGDDDEDAEQCKWADHVIDDKNKCGSPDEPPRTIFSAFLHAVESNALNFALLYIIASILQKVEKWSFIDVLYYWNCTATTIGFGDICPQTQLGRLLAIVFIPLSVVTLGEVIANVFAFINGRIAAKAEKDFLRREITLSDLEYLDVNDDGKVCELDFITFMLVAMQKVDRKTMKDLQRLFHALDAGKDGLLQKEDLITLRQRKRFAKRLKRDARKNELWFETRLFKDKKKGKKWFGWSF